MTETIDCVPSALVGKHSGVARKWRQILRKAIQTGSWDEALRNEPMIPLREARGLFVLVEYNPMLVHGDAVFLYDAKDLLFDECMDACIPDYDRCFLMLRDLIMSGTDSLWFSMALLSLGILFPQGTRYDVEMPIVARQILAKMHRWWDKFCEYDLRLFNGVFVGWPVWTVVVGYLCREMGVPDEKTGLLRGVSKEEAGVLVARWLKEREA